MPGHGGNNNNIHGLAANNADVDHGDHPFLRPGLRLGPRWLFRRNRVVVRLEIPHYLYLVVAAVALLVAMLAGNAWSSVSSSSSSGAVVASHVQTAGATTAALSPSHTGADPQQQHLDQQPGEAIACQTEEDRRKEEKKKKKRARHEQAIIRAACSLHVEIAELQGVARGQVDIGRMFVAPPAGPYKTSGSIPCGNCAQVPVRQGYGSKNPDRFIGQSLRCECVRLEREEGRQGLRRVPPPSHHGGEQEGEQGVGDDKQQGGRTDDVWEGSGTTASTAGNALAVLEEAGLFWAAEDARDIYIKRFREGEADDDDDDDDTDGARERRIDRLCKQVGGWQ